MHSTTSWQIQPSFKFDVLCLLNALTGDPYYLTFYRGEFDVFSPNFTPAVREALADLKQKIRDDGKRIISAFLCLCFSATEDETVEDMLNTLENSEVMRINLKKTPFYKEPSWQLYESVRDSLRVIFSFLLLDTQFGFYWQEEILPKLRQRISVIEEDLWKYNVIGEAEAHLGFPLPSDVIIVYMLYYCQPHGIRVTGTRFLTYFNWPFEIVVRTAVHEMLHPPYQLSNDDELENALRRLRDDEFLMDKVLNHNPSFGYNTLEGFVEENCVQVLDQIINERLKIAMDARRRWRESDDGMHVLAPALYSIMKEENYSHKGECFRDFLIRIIQTGRLAPGEIKTIYETFYSAESFC